MKTVIFWALVRMKDVSGEFGLGPHEIQPVSDARVKMVLMILDIVDWVSKSDQ
jgi:hypothetical protein